MEQALIETPRLLLRPFLRSDGPAAFGWFGDARVMRYTPSGPDVSLQQTEARIAEYERHQAAHGFSKWVVLDRETRRPIGDSGLLVLPESGNIDLGFRLAVQWWGKGIATEAARAWVRAAFDHFAMPRLTAFAHPDNHTSLRVLEKLGFRRERAAVVMGMQSLVFSLQLAQAGPG
jgi:RimJ/RimL family protein N-acetyltransferase